MEKYTSFKPGQPWFDTDGNLIQAHGGYMFQENGKFYWYGENKEKSETEREIWHWGVRLYSSEDLYNWKSEGVILPPELDDETSPTYYNSKLDRPHILYNEKTKLYVMWFKVMPSKYSKSNYAAIAVSKSILGPFKVVKTGYQPYGFQFGDFELVQYGEKAYIIFEKPHTEMIFAPLSDDYMSVEGEFKSHFHNGHPPFIREAPATFVHNNRVYLITSGTTAKFPNPSETAVSNSYVGDWEIIGNPHVGNTKTSFDSQISCIFKHPKKKNLFIAMADRWLIDLPDNLPNIFEIFDCIYDPNKESVPYDETMWTKRNTKNARYVWLPIEFDGETPVIKWYDEWRWEDFE